MESGLVQDVGARIRRLRKARGWTQTQLAEHSGLTQSYIGQIERGEQNITLSTLEQILHALGASAAELFDDK